MTEANEKIVHAHMKLVIFCTFHVQCGMQRAREDDEKSPSELYPGVFVCVCMLNKTNKPSVRTHQIKPSAHHAAVCMYLYECVGKTHAK